MRDLVTTCFEVGGLLLLVVAAGLEVAALATAPAGLATAGVLLLLSSAVIVRLAPTKRSGEETV